MTTVSRLTIHPLRGCTWSRSGYGYGSRAWSSLHMPKSIGRWVHAGSVRLQGGLTSYEGFVEVQVDGKWGAVCGYGSDGPGWNTLSAQVVCRQIGLPAAGARAYTGYLPEINGFNPVGRGSSGTLPYTMSSVQCSGGEEQLGDCPHTRVASPVSFTCFSDAGMRNNMID